MSSTTDNPMEPEEGLLCYRRPIRLGTRGSALALAQSNQIADAIRQESHQAVEIVIVKTTADRAPEVPLSRLGDKGLWVVDLERDLLDGHIDLAVHSLKDVPMDLAPGTILGCVPERECPLDALVLRAGGLPVDPILSASSVAPDRSRDAETKDALDRILPPYARVGTSSERRRTQLQHWRPDLRISPIRGNVDTRLRKLDDGEFDALALAAAGLRRLGRTDRISALIPASLVTPAAGQGALGLQIREDDTRLRAILNGLNHGPSETAVTAERAFVKAVGGGCSVPLGAFAEVRGSDVVLCITAIVAAPPGFTIAPLRDEMLIGTQTGLDRDADLSRAEAAGIALAERFLKNNGEWKSSIGD